MLLDSAFSRFVVILKGMEEKDRVPFGYVKVQAIADVVDLEIVLQKVEKEKEEKIALVGIVKRFDRFYPAFFCYLEHPKKDTIFQILSTNRFNMFRTGYQLKDIAGFAIVKEKKGKRKLLLIGSIDDKDLYVIEKDILNELEDAKRKQEKEEKKDENIEISSENFLNEDSKELSIQDITESKFEKGQETDDKNLATDNPENLSLQIVKALSQETSENLQKIEENEGIIFPRRKCF